MNEGKTAAIRADLISTHAQAVITAMKQMGVSKEEALRMVAALWDEM